MPSRPPAQVAAEHEVHPPGPRLAGADQPLRLAEAAAGGEDQRHRQVGGGVVEHSRRVGDGDAAPGGGREVDVVVADGDVGDAAQAGAGGVEELVVDPVAQQGEDGVGSGDERQQLRARQRRLPAGAPHLARPSQQRQPRLRQPAGDHERRSLLAWHLRRL
jgi:hypothetical protein